MSREPGRPGRTGARRRAHGRASGSRSRIAARAASTCSGESCDGAASPSSESASLIGSACDGVRLSARATATSSEPPPHSSTRVKSHDAPVGDREDRPLVADRDRDDGRARLRVLGRGSGEGAQEREGLEVDALELQPGTAAGIDVALDELAVREDEQHADGRLEPPWPAPSPSTTWSRIASVTAIGSVSCAWKRIEFSNSFGSSSAGTSSMRTPIRLLAIPSRTPRRGSLFCGEEGLQLARERSRRRAPRRRRRSRAGSMTVRAAPARPSRCCGRTRRRAETSRPGDRRGSSRVACAAAVAATVFALRPRASEA